jgi:phage gp36-like protein
MATQTIRVYAPIAAGSYTVNVQTDGSNTNAFTGRTLTAESVSGFWTFTVTSASAGLYAFQVLSGSTVVAYGWFYSGTDATVTIHDSDSRDDALQTQRIGLPSGASLAADIAAGGGGSISQNDIDSIVAGLAESLTAPGFAASVSIVNGTYATVADVEARLTAYGVTFAADVDTYNGTRGSTETTLIEVAIEYSNCLIDEYIIDLVHPTSHRATATFTRPTGIAWLRDRCVDIACYRLATLGGRSASDVLAGDYASAIDRLAKAREQIIRIPHLVYTSPTRPYATEYGGGIGIVRRAGT